MAAMFRLAADFGDPRFSVSLQVLLADLGRRSAATAGATCILDEAAGTVTVAIAGRDRDWDLGRWPACLLDRWPGLELLGDDRLGFGQAASFLNSSHVPDWALESSSWSSLAAGTKRPARVDRPAGVSSGKVPPGCGGPPKP